MNKPEPQRKSARLLPDFLCIGAQRSGTSWLYENLGAHPQVWLPPIKEIHYFNSRNKPLRRKLNVYFRHLRGRILKDLQDKKPFANLVWDLHYFLGPRSDRWYQGLFRPAADQVAGEITPDYAALELAEIKHIYKLNPDLKIIYLMRDPIERSWSGATKDLARQKGRKLDTVPDDELLKKLNGPGTMARSNHLLVLEKWESVFDSKQIFIGFFDNIEQNPAQLLRSIFHFLGVSEADEHIPPDIDRKVNSAGRYKSAIPLRFQFVLAKQQIDQLRVLSKTYGGHATKWLKRAQDVLDMMKK